MNESLLTVEDMCNELGIGRSKAYQILKTKKFHRVRLDGEF